MAMTKAEKAAAGAKRRLDKLGKKGVKKVRRVAAGQQTKVKVKQTVDKVKKKLTPKPKPKAKPKPKKSGATKVMEKGKKKLGRMSEANKRKTARRAKVADVKKKVGAKVTKAKASYKKPGVAEKKIGKAGKAVAKTAGKVGKVVKGVAGRAGAVGAAGAAGYGLGTAMAKSKHGQRAQRDLVDVFMRGKDKKAKEAMAPIKFTPEQKARVKAAQAKKKAAGAKVTGSGGKTNKAGKANVTREQLKASGHSSLRGYMNAWNRNGKRPTGSVPKSRGIKPGDKAPTRQKIPAKSSSPTKKVQPKPVKGGTKSPAALKKRLAAQRKRDGMNKSGGRKK